MARANSEFFSVFVNFVFEKAFDTHTSSLHLLALFALELVVTLSWYLNYPWDSRLIKGRHNGGLIYFGSSYKHCQHDLADH